MSNNRRARKEIKLESGQSICLIDFDELGLRDDVAVDTYMNNIICYNEQGEKVWVVNRDAPKISDRWLAFIDIKENDGPNFYGTTFLGHQYVISKISGCAQMISGANN